MNFHGVNRSRPLEQAGSSANVEPTLPAAAPKATTRASTNLRAAATHAESLQLLGWIILGLGVLGLFAATYAGVDGRDPAALVVALPALLGSSVIWAVLRSFALVLTLMVDRAAEAG